MTTETATPFQPNATVNVSREGDLIHINHMSRSGSRHVIPLTVEADRMLAEELVEQASLNADPSRPSLPMEGPEPRP